MKQAYLSNHLLQMHGDDFNYMSAHEYYKNLDKLIRYFEIHPELGLNLSYSVPSRYFDSIKSEKIKFPTKIDDFLPYAIDKNTFFTGF